MANPAPLSDREARALVAVLRLHDYGSALGRSAWLPDHATAARLRERGLLTDDLVPTLTPAGAAVADAQDVTALCRRARLAARAVVPATLPAFEELVFDDEVAPPNAEPLRTSAGGRSRD